MDTTKKPKDKWRESSSLIIVKQNQKDSAAKHDYELLMLKRTSETSMFPNTCVFPGGHFDTADESVAWLQYFEEFGITQDALKELVILGDQTQRARILLPQGNGCYDRFFKKSFIWAREISLRINAIRETFEEVGVLICRNREELSGAHDYCRIHKDFDKAYWQQRVHSNAGEFLNLCRLLKVVPDLWSLHEWSAWASPAIMKFGNETAFFITFVQEDPHILVESSEVDEVMWVTPDVITSKFLKGDVFLFPPQVYEMYRFLTVHSFDKLQSFAYERRQKGTTLMMPVSYQCTDGYVGVYPGDNYYVDDPRSAVKPIATNVTVQEFLDKTKNTHRGVGLFSHHTRFHISIPPLNGHLKPLEYYNGDSSKL